MMRRARSIPSPSRSMPRSRWPVPRWRWKSPSPTVAMWPCPRASAFIRPLPGRCRAAATKESHRIVFAEDEPATAQPDRRAGWIGADGPAETPLDGRHAVASRRSVRTAMRWCGNPVASRSLRYGAAGRPAARHRLSRHAHARRSGPSPARASSVSSRGKASPIRMASPARSGTSRGCSGFAPGEARHLRMQVTLRA